MNDFKRKILKLIQKGYEGSYWDFKQEHHLNRADLLHDIICLVNNLENRDAYIIFGVKDNGEIIGIDPNGKRRNQEQFVTFLRNKNFEAGYRPIVELISFKIHNNIIEVLVIKQSNRTPYYLTKPFHDGKKIIKQYHIYSRIQDTNTAQDTSADESVVEQLWKRRFGLLPTPIEKLEFALRDKDNWTRKNGVKYYNPSPEFTVTLIQEESDYRRDNREFYSYNQMNSSTSYETIQCKYFTTVLYETEGVILDSGRYSATTADWGNINIDEYGQERLVYKYYIKNSLDYLITKFLYDEDNHEQQIAQDKYLELILVYESKQEKGNFEKYILRNINKVLEKLTKKKMENVVFSINEERVRLIENERIHTGILLKKLLEKYRFEVARLQ